MVELEQYKYQWNQYADQLEELRKAFDIQAKKERIEEIAKMISGEEITDSSKVLAKELMKEAHQA